MAPTDVVEESIPKRFMDMKTAANTFKLPEDLDAAREALGLRPWDKRGPAVIDIYYTETVNGERSVSVPIPLAVDRYIEVARAEEKRAEGKMWGKD